jgi:hypothetical protein
MLALWLGLVKGPRVRVIVRVRINLQKSHKITIYADAGKILDIIPVTSCKL